VGRVLEVNFPEEPASKAAFERVAAVVRASLPVDSEVVVIVIQYPVASRDRWVVRSSAATYYVDSLTRLPALAAPSGALAEHVAKEAGGPLPTIGYRVDVLGNTNQRVAETLHRWVERYLTLYADMDSLIINFRGTETGRVGNARFISGAGRVGIATQRGR